MCDGFVGHLDVQRLAIGVGIDGDRLDAHLARGLDDAAGDLAAIGNEDFLEHYPLAPCLIWKEVSECRGRSI